MKELKDPPAPTPELDEPDEPMAEMAGDEGLRRIVECGL